MSNCYFAFEYPDTLRGAVCHAERLAIFVGNRHIERQLGPWSVSRAAEITCVTAAILGDLHRRLLGEFDAYGHLTEYLDDLHAALRLRQIFDAPCCGGLTECGS